VKLSRSIAFRAAGAAAAALWLASGPPAAQAVETPAEALARELDARHKSLGDLTARFVQTYRSGLMQREIVESGTVSIKRPGRMRWEYTKPEKKLFIADGKAFYFYVPADKQVIVQESAGQRGIPSLLLSGRSGIQEEFQVALEDAPGGRPRLKCTPRKADPEVETVYIEADERRRVRSIEVLDPQGNRSRFVFDEIRENVGLKDGLFTFRVPSGVEVVKG
jgi:outer membrane lipoprotein carrier protein